MNSAQESESIMSREAPPIMRKLLLGQLVDMEYSATTWDGGIPIHSIPLPPGRQLLFSLVWLQGRVLGTPSSPSSLHFLLDDGTGSILVTIQPDTELPPQGTYVSVVGEIVRAVNGSQGAFGNALPSLTSFQLAARSVMCLSLIDGQFADGDRSVLRRTPSSVYAELAWPLEVIDMNRRFSAPA